MAKDARQPIAGWRNEALVLPIRVVGIDVTGLAVRAQVRLAPGTPGAPLIDLTTQANAAAEGIRLASVTTIDGVPTSSLILRINKSSMQSLPATGELGSPTLLAYALQIGAVTRLYGEFVVLDSAIDSDTNPANRLPAYGSSSASIGVADGLSLTIGNDGVTVAIDGIGRLAEILSAAQVIVTAANAARNAAIVARAGSEQARDTSRGWAEGPVPIGGNRSSKGWAEAAQASAAVSDTARTAIEQAIAQVPTDTRLPIEASDLSVLLNVAADTPIGRLAFLSPRGLAGVWQLRAGDYSAQTAADTYNARYMKVAAIPATQAAWVRIIVGDLFRFSWTGLTGDTADALPYLKAGFAIFDANARWELPPHLLRLPTNAKPSLLIEKQGVHLYGFGRSTAFDYTGTLNAFEPEGLGLIQLAASDVKVSDLHISLRAPNNSAGNPAVISVSPRQSMLDATSTLPELTRLAIRDVSYDRTSTGIMVSAYGKTDHSTGFRRPTNVLIENIEGSGNGAAVSLFGGEDIDVRDYHFRFDPSLPSNSPVAKKCGFRILGSVDVRIGDGVIDGYQEGLYLDAAYFGARAKNKNVSIGNIDMPNVEKPILIVECEGRFDMIGTVRPRLPTNNTIDGNTASVVRVLANLPLSTIPASAPESDKFSTVGDVNIRGINAEGYAIGVFHQGVSGKLSVDGNIVVGNANTSIGTSLRGGVLVSGISGLPLSVRVNDNDFRMTVAPGLPSLLLDASAGLIEARRNLLPERDDPENSIIVPAGNAIITDDVVQRPFNRTANLGTNRQHPVGALANYRDGTRIPAPAAPTSAPWTRNLVGVAESPTGIFTKNAGAANAYDAAVYSAERIVGDFEIIYRLLQKSDDLAVGVISAYGGANYAFIQHAILYQSNGASTVYSRGGAQIRPAGGYDAATIERLRRQGSRLILTRNNVEMLNLPVSSELALGLQASIARMGDAVEILRFGAI